MPGKRPSFLSRPEIRVPVCYAIFSWAWVYGSDALLAGLATSIEQQRIVHAWKAAGFLVVTGILLYALIRRAVARERAETRRAEESEALLRAVTDSIPEPIYLSGLDGRLAFANPAMLALVDRRPEAALGRTLAELGCDAAWAAAAAEADRRVLASGALETVEERFSGPGGTRALLTTRAPRRDAAGSVVGVIVVARDVTERNAAEAAARAAEERFRRAQKLESVGRLAGGVAHDFNNLLTVILATCDAVEHDLQEMRPVAAEDVAEIREAGERARDLTRRLLAVARRQEAAPVALDLNETVRSAERLLRRAIGEDIRLVVDLEPDPWKVLADPGQVEQVLLNLAVNARDAMPRGGCLAIKTANRAVDEPMAARDPDLHAGEWVSLAVDDTGSGMAPEVMAHLFEPFFTTKPKGHGTGLGLATAYGTIRQAGGHLRVRSAPSEGSTFEILLPRLRAEPVAPEPRPGVEPARTGGSELVLLVEDDGAVRVSTDRALRQGGYRVLLAADGAEALSVLSRLDRPPDLVVTDVVMPGMDGGALAAEIRRLHRNVKVLFISGHPPEVIGDHGVWDGGVAFLAKPYTTAALLARVRSLLDDRLPGADPTSRK